MGLKASAATPSLFGFFFFFTPRPHTDVAENEHCLRAVTPLPTQWTGSLLELLMFGLTLNAHPRPLVLHFKGKKKMQPSLGE